MPPPSPKLRGSTGKATVVCRDQLSLATTFHFRPPRNSSECTRDRNHHAGSLLRRQPIPSLQAGEHVAHISVYWAEELRMLATKILLPDRAISRFPQVSARRHLLFG
jgi:hypothetical protein